MRAITSLSDRSSESQHAFVAILTMMNWCKRHGLIEASPVPVMSFKTEARSRILTDEELHIVWKRAEAYGYPYGSIIQLLILTGQRRGEIAGLKWNWVGEGSITFPHGFTKNSREHTIPVGPLAQKIISQLPQTSDLLFPSRFSGDTVFSGWSKTKRAFDKEIKIAPYTLHDLRRTYSSNMARLGVPIHVTEKLLNHVSGTVSGIAAVYNRYTYIDEMREAVANFDGYLAKLIQK